MEVSGQLHAAAVLPPGKDPPGTHWIGGCVDPIAGLNVLGTRKKPCPCRESNPGFPARILVTILIELPCLNCRNIP
jgi:hypothetical protein